MSLKSFEHVLILAEDLNKTKSFYVDFGFKDILDLIFLFQVIGYI